MKKAMNVIVRLALLVMVLSCVSCASSGGHEKYRGNENSPFTQFNTHNVDPNLVMNMNKQQFDDYMRKLNAMQDYKDRMNTTNAGSAAAESMWVAPTQSNSNGGSFIGELFNTFRDTANGIVRDAGQDFRNRMRQ